MFFFFAFLNGMKQITRMIICVYYYFTNNDGREVNTVYFFVLHNEITHKTKRD